MKHIYKYGFYFFILCSFTLFNIWNISRKQAKSQMINNNIKAEKRIDSFQKSDILLKRKVPEIYGIDAITGTRKKIISRDSTYLVVLLSRFDCAKCQVNELKDVNKLKNDLMSYGIKPLCITKKMVMNEILVRMRNMKIRLPLFVVPDSVFAKISFDIEYPQVELINKCIISSAFLPVKQDYEFSSIYYKGLLKVLREEDFVGMQNSSMQQGSN